MSDNLSPLDQLIQQEAQSRADAEQILGEHAATVEQDGYQQSIDDRRLQQPPPRDGWLTDTAKAVWNALPNAAAETVIGYDWAVTHLAGGSDTDVGLGGVSHADLAADVRAKANLFKFDRPNETLAGDLTGGVAQFIAGMYSGRSETQLLGLTGKLGTTAASVATMATSFNPNTPQLANLLDRFPSLKEYVPDFLRSDPNKSEGENRLAAGLTGLGLDLGFGAGAALFSWLKGARAVQNLNETAEAIENTPSTPVESPQAKPEATPSEPEGTPQDRFMRDFEATNPEHSTQVGARAVGDTAVDMSRDPFDPRVVHLENIRADQPGNGAGSAAMQSITDLADQHGVKITLDAIPLSPTEGSTQIPLEKLQSFYEQHGFHPAEGGMVEGQAMERFPQARPEPTPATAAEAMPHPSTPGLAIEIPPEKVESVLAAIKDGRYNDAVGLLDDTHRTIPWDSMSDGNALKNVFAAVEDGIGHIIKNAAGVTSVPKQAIVQLAKDIGGNVNVLDRLYQGVTGEGGLAARITAGYNMMVASARQLKDLAAKVNELRPDTPEGAQALVDFQKQLTLHGAIVGQVRQSSAEIGRALWAHRQLKASSDVALSNMMDYANTPVGTSTLQKLAQTITDSGDLASLTNAADQVNGKGWWNVVREIATNGMLASPKTQLTNAAGLLVKSSLALVERYVAAGIGVGQRMLGSEDAATFREAWAHTVGMSEGIRAAWKLAAKSATDENFVSQFSQPTTQAIARSTEGRVGADLALSQAINFVGKAVRWPGRAMGLLDHFSQAVGYYGDLNARAYSQAAAEADAKGLADAAREDYLGSRIADLKANPTAELQEKAMDAGRYQAFLEDAQTPLAAIPQALNKVPLLKLIVAPFTHRPGNLLRQGLVDYSPLSLAYSDTRAAITSTLKGAGTADDALRIARGVVGTSLLLEGLNQAESGNLTGGRLGSKNTESLDGIPTYSIKVGDRWIKYDRIDPIGLWLGASADLHEFLSRHYDPSDTAGVTKAQQFVQAIVQTMSNVAFDKSFLKSADLAVQAMGERDPEKADELFAQFASSNVAKFLPFSGALGAAAQAVDPTQRSTKGGNIYDALIAKLPYLSESLPARRDLLGRPMPVQSAWNPFAGSTANADQMDQELAKLALKINPPSRTISGFQLDPHEYDNVIERATTSPIFGGLTLEQKLRELTSSDAWANNASAPDGGALRNGSEVQSLINAAYDFGRQSYLRDHHDLIDQKVAQQRAKFQASKPAAPAAQASFDRFMQAPK